MDVIVSKGMSIKQLKEDQIFGHLEKEGIEFTSNERYDFVRLSEGERRWCCSLFLFPFLYFKFFL